MIVASMLIDDGVPSRGHRQNLLDARFKVIGVAIGPHPSYGHMCVIDLAGSYEGSPDLAPQAAPAPARATEQ
jgi:hypothetical protein